jgi:hypothetical protein
MMDTGSNRPVIQMNAEAISEVKVMVSGYQAEYGRAAGLQITAVSKTGSNQFRGSAYDVERNSAWNANSKTNILNGDPKPVNRERDFGFTLGGPVGKPGGAKKLFFFFSQEFDPRTSGNVVTRYRVPTALERAGDFSQTTDQNGLPYPYIKDPSKNGVCSAASQVACFADGGVLGRIPASSLYAPGLNILKWFPLPNLTNVPAGQSYNLELTKPTQSLTSHQSSVRVDYQPTSKFRVGARYTVFAQSNKFVTLGTIPGFNDTIQPHPTNNASAVIVNYSVTPTTYLEANIGHARDTTIAACGLNGGTNGIGAEFCTSGLPTNPGSTRTAAGFGGLPQVFGDANVIDPRFFVYEVLTKRVSIPGWDGKRLDLAPTFSFGSRVANAPPNITYSGFGTNPTVDVSVALTKVTGPHTMKFGVYRTRSFKTASAGAFGTISFAQDTVGTNAFDTSYGFANAAIGSFSSFAQPTHFNESDSHWANVEGYAQDTWRATPRLSLDYGVRFVHAGPQRDIFGQQSNFSLSDWQAANAPLQIYRPACANGVYPCSGTNRQAQDPTTGQFMGPSSSVLIGTAVPNSGNATAGVTLLPGNKFPYDWPAVVFGPRFGSAYDLTGDQKTILRGTAGMFYSRGGGGSSGSANPGLNQTVTLRYSQFQSLGSTGLAVQSAPSVSGNTTADLPVASSAQWNLEVQRLLPWAMAIDVGYVGVRSFNSSQARNLNSIDLGAAFLPQNQDPTLSSTTPGGNALPADLLRQYRGLSSVSITGTDTTNRELVHTLQVSLQRRLRNGVSFGFNDGMVLTDTLNSPPRLEHRADGSVFIRSDQALSDKLLGTAVPRKHVLKANVVWQLPNITSQSGALRALATLANDWQLSGIWTGTTGLAYSADFSYSSGGTSTNLTGSPDYAARVRIVGNPGSGCSSDLNRQFTAAAFQGPLYNSVGLESGAGYLRGCFQSNFDLALVRRIPVGQGRAVSLRLDVFNFFNEGRVAGVNSVMQLSSPSDPTTIQNLPFDASGALIPTRIQPKNAGFGVANVFQSPRSLQAQVRFQF